MIYIDCVFLRYIGKKPFSLCSEKGKKYTFKEGDLICLKDDDLSRALIYKKTLFEVYQKRGGRNSTKAHIVAPNNDAVEETPNTDKGEI